MTSVLLGDAHGISVVDFKPFLDGSAKQDVANAILDSFKRVGFVYLINHGIPEDKIQGMFEWSKRFFAQPMEVKQQAPHPPSGTHHRGYSAPGREKIVQPVFDGNELKDVRDKVPDVKESFECGWEENAGTPNIWLPDGILPGFKEACTDFYWTCHETELQVLRAITIGFGIGEEYLVKYHHGHDNQMRLLHYPSVPAAQLKDEKITRISAHSDYGSITLLLQDDAGGLEVEDPNNPGGFMSAPPVAGALVVNAADLMMRWSNDVIRSTVHRVRAPPNVVDGMVADRYSIPYFCSPASLTRVWRALSRAHEGFVRKPPPWSNACPVLTLQTNLPSTNQSPRESIFCDVLHRATKRNKLTTVPTDHRLPISAYLAFTRFSVLVLTP